MSDYKGDEFTYLLCDLTTTYVSNVPKMWEIDGSSNAGPILSAEEKQFEEHFSRTICRNEKSSF